VNKQSKTVTDNFAQVYPAYVGAVVDLLITLRSQFDGDLDAALIMSVIGDRQFARRVSMAAPTRATLGQTETTDQPSVNAYSIAQYTGIARETVRRKVAMLVEKGWVCRDGQGNLSPSEKAAKELLQSTDAAVGLIETIAATARS